MKKRLIGLVAVPVALYLLLALVFWLWGTARLHFEVKRWEALGVPTRLADWRPQDVPPETNAAPLYEQLRGRLQLTDADAAALDDPWSIANPAEFIKPYEEVLALYEVLASRSELVWDDRHFQLRCDNWCGDCTGIFYAWQGIGLSDLTRLMLVKIRAVHESGGDVSHWVALAWQHASLAKSTGFCVDALTGLRVENLLLEALPQFRSVSPEFYRGYLSRMAESDPASFLRKAAAYEAMLHLQFYEGNVPIGGCSQIVGEKLKFVPDVPLGQWPLMRGVTAINVANALERMRGVHSDPSAIAQIERAGEQRVKHFNWYKDNFDRLGTSYPCHVIASRFQIELRIKELAAMTLPAIFQIKQDRGEYPDVVPMPVEPDTGEVATYERLKEGGFVIRRTQSYTREDWEWRFLDPAIKAD